MSGLQRDSAPNSSSELTDEELAQPNRLLPVGGSSTRRWTALAMIRLVRELAVVVACYVLAWALCFVFVVGARPDLVTGYFVMGWTFAGLELPSFVWLGTWPLFLALYSTARILWWRGSRLRNRAV
jgi:hypothetical protein